MTGKKGISLKSEHGNEDKFPFPFCCLKAEKSNGSSGKCWTFYNDNQGRFLGYLFPGGYRLMNNIKQTDSLGEFFLENRNFPQSKYGLLGAIVPKRPISGKLINCMMILVMKIYADDKGVINLMFRKYESKINQKETLFNLGAKNRLDEFFSIPTKVKIDTVNIVYVNSMNNLKPTSKDYQMCQIGPDRYVLNHHLVKDDIRLNWSRKKDYEYLPVTRRDTREFLPRRLKNSLFVTNIHIVTINEKKKGYFHVNDRKLMLIPYDIKPSIVTFAYITQFQNNNLRRVFRKKQNGMEDKEYKSVLAKYQEINGTELLTILLLCNIKEHNQGQLVCICADRLCLPKGIRLVHDEVENVYLQRCTRNPSDFELPKSLIAIFRSYPWPFCNEFSDDIIKLFSSTFPGKGLKRQCTFHDGNFEMIGERNSKQSTGSLLMLPEMVDKHQYYRETMNLNLLPHTKTLINVLMEQSIEAGYSSGESIMNYMKRILNKRDAKSLCYNSIITQRNFNNSIHKDKKSVFSKESTATMKTYMSNSCEIKNLNHANQYVQPVLEHTNNVVPKSTTCCWRLSKDYDHIIMYQYFVSPQYMFGLDISSHILRDEKDVGATFMSSMFYHSTSVPIWKDKKGNIYLEGPKDMYNFAWGSNGTSNEK